jgi:hypothetical protein
MNDMKFTTAEDYMKDSEEIPYNNDTEENRNYLWNKTRFRQKYIQRF